MFFSNKSTKCMYLLLHTIIILISLMTETDKAQISADT